MSFCSGLRRGCSSTRLQHCAANRWKQPSRFSGERSRRSASNWKKPMPDLTDDRSQFLDDELARFTDRLLGGEPPDTQESAGVDTELTELERTAARLHHAFGAGGPDRAMADRIRANLASEWRKVHTRSAGLPFWRRQIGRASCRERV